MADAHTDCLAFGPHPDDIELGCSGTLIKMTRAGRSVVLVDITEGELSTRGTVEDRRREAEDARVITGARERINLGIEDGNIESTPVTRLAVIGVLRKYRPDTVLLPYEQDRHPDHVRASRLIYEAAFASGLARIQDGQPPYRPERLLYYLLWDEFEPTFVVDVTETFEDKMRAVAAYRTQFDARDTRYPPTRLTSKDFAWRLTSRMGYYGSRIRRGYGEPFLIRGSLEMACPMEARFSTF